jgi:hypothetical protein
MFFKIRPALENGVEDVISNAYEEVMKTFEAAGSSPDFRRQDCGRILDLKKQRANFQKDAYLETMLKNVAYLQVTINEYYRMFEHQVMASPDRWSMQKYQETMVYLNEEIRKIELVGPDFRNLYKQFGNVDQQLEQLEFDYFFYSNAQMVLISALALLTTKAEYNSKLDRSKGGNIMECLKGSNKLHTNILLGNIKFGSAA